MMEEKFNAGAPYAHNIEHLIGEIHDRETQLQNITKADCHLIAIYGDIIHHSESFHLDNRIDSNPT